jgi:hypothetical protein
MLHQNLKNYIESQGTASAGALLIPFTERWLPTPWTKVRGEPNETFAFAWRQVVPGAEFSHSVTTSGESSHGLHVAVRVFCHVLTNLMPERALPDLCQTILELYELHSTAPALSSKTSVDALSDASQLHALVDAIRESRPLPAASAEVDQLLSRALQSRGKPEDVRKWADQLANEVADLTD